MDKAALEAHFAALPADARQIWAELIDVFMTRVDAAIDAAGVDAVVAMALSIYDKFIAPIDVPFVPEFVEKTVFDPTAKYLLEQAIRGFHDRVHREP